MSRKKVILTLVLAFVVSFAVFFALGLFQPFSPSREEKSPKDAEEKTFTCEEMSITLTSAFEETEVDYYTAAYDSSEVAVLALKEAKDLFGEAISFDEYLGYVKKANENRGFVNMTEIEETDGLICFDYLFTNTEQNTEYHYLTTLHEADEAFWQVQFVAPSDSYDNYMDIFVNWAKTITFA